MYADAGTHHGNGRHAVWCKSTLENQAFLLRANQERLFKPPYVGPSGWVGVWLDQGTDWDDLAELIRDAYRLAAPDRLRHLLDDVPL